jgi:hypothetical protein
VSNVYDPGVLQRRHSMPFSAPCSRQVLAGAQMQRYLPDCMMPLFVAVDHSLQRLLASEARRP